jgi:hypothetical protein
VPAVLLLFLIPIGGGIPAGVLLAQAKGLAWTTTAALYLLSDLILAVAFEPVLRVLLWLASKSAFLTRVGAAMREATARTLAPYAGTVTGPLGLVLVAFGVDPMTGRAAALAAGYGPFLGWAFAIMGDMLYYAVVALATLKLHALVGNPEVAVAGVLLAMMLVPVLVRRVRGRIRVG